MYIEYKDDLNLRNFLLQTKNNLIIKSFIIVFSMIGILICDKILTLHNEIKNITIFVYIIPYFMLVPISSRVAYYRIWGAYLSAKINIFTNNKVDSYPEISFLNNYNLQNSKKDKINLFIHKIICFMVNFELFILSLGCFFIFIISVIINNYNFITIIICFIISAISNIYIFLIFKNICNYEKLYDVNKQKWTTYVKNNNDIKNTSKIDL